MSADLYTVSIYIMDPTRVPRFIVCLWLDGLFTYTETDTGTDPGSGGYPPDCTMATVVLCRKFTPHTKWGRIPIRRPLPMATVAILGQISVPIYPFSRQFQLLCVYFLLFIVPKMLSANE